MKKLLTILILLALVPSVMAVYGGGDVSSGSSSSSGGGGGGSGSSSGSVVSVPVAASCASGVTCGADCCLTGERCYLGGCMTTSLIAMLEADLAPEPEAEATVPAAVEKPKSSFSPTAMVAAAVDLGEKKPVSVAVLFSAAILALAVLLYFYFEHKK